MADLYAKSGVNIDAGNETVRRIKDVVKSTHTPEVLTGIGSFGSLYDMGKTLKNYKHPVLVQSIDGVGTKLTVAKMMNKYDTVGEDIVGHGCGDIVAMGARPLTFLDYVANETLEPDVMEQIVGGMAKACKEAGVALVGGETAEMPGIYASGEHDIAGTIMGIVEKDKIITGEKIQEGDVLFGLASSGLHTNGFSLARKILFETAGYKIGESPEGLGMSIGEALLKTHTNYTKPVLALLDTGIDIRGIAHITGGGLLENIPRVLPENLSAEIKKASWPILPIFELIQKEGNVTEEDMYRTLNMGIGMVLIAPQNEAEKIKKLAGIHKVFEIGKIVKGGGEVILL